MSITQGCPGPGLDAIALCRFLPGCWAIPKSRPDPVPGYLQPFDGEGLCCRCEQGCACGDDCFSSHFHGLLLSFVCFLAVRRSSAPLGTSLGRRWKSKARPAHSHSRETTAKRSLCQESPGRAIERASRRSLTLAGKNIGSGFRNKIQALATQRLTPRTGYRSPAL